MIGIVTRKGGKFYLNPHRVTINLPVSLVTIEKITSIKCRTHKIFVCNDLHRVNFFYYRTNFEKKVVSRPKSSSHAMQKRHFLLLTVFSTNGNTKKVSFNALFNEKCCSIFTEQRFFFIEQVLVNQILQKNSLFKPKNALFLKFLSKNDAKN